MPGLGARPSQWPKHNDLSKPPNLCPCTLSNHNWGGIPRPVTRQATTTVTSHLPPLTIPRVPLGGHTLWFEAGHPAPTTTTFAVLTAAVVMAIVASFTVSIALTVTLNTTIAIGVTELRHIAVTQLCRL